jgi:hypothetical protein
VKCPEASVTTLLLCEGLTTVTRAAATGVPADVVTTPEMDPVVPAIARPLHTKAAIRKMMTRIFIGEPSVQASAILCLNKSRYHDDYGNFA